jgi:uncharacterized membrane-anchored protein
VANIAEGSVVGSSSDDRSQECSQNTEPTLMFPDTVLLAKALFPLIGVVTAAAERDNATMLRVLSAAELS